MGIGWLWLYTHSDNPAPLARANETRAFAFYSRWRAFHRWAGNIFNGICVRYHKRIARRTLLALPDHLLRDIGMFRTGGDVRVEKTCRLETRIAEITEAEEITDEGSGVDHIDSAVIMKIDCWKKKPGVKLTEHKNKAQG